MTRIMLADDHPIVRHGMRTLLEADGRYQVVGEAADGLTAVAMVEQLQPDLLIVDLMMPGLGGLEVTRRVRECSPRTRVILMSLYGNEPYVLEALRHGAQGYVLKAAGTPAVLEAVEAVLGGRRYLSPPLTERAIDAYIAQAAGSAAEFDPYERLTGREREVLHMAAQSMTNAAIGERLGISPRTVETHRTHLMRKLNLSNHSELLGYAQQRGLLSDPNDPGVIDG